MDDHEIIDLFEVQRLTRELLDQLTARTWLLDHATVVCERPLDAVAARSFGSKSVDPKKAIAVVAFSEELAKSCDAVRAGAAPTVAGSSDTAANSKAALAQMTLRRSSRICHGERGTHAVKVVREKCRVRNPLVTAHRAANGLTLKSRFSNAQVKATAALRMHLHRIEGNNTGGPRKIGM